MLRMVKIGDGSWPIADRTPLVMMNFRRLQPLPLACSPPASASRPPSSRSSPAMAVAACSRRKLATAWIYPNLPSMVVSIRCSRSSALEKMGFRSLRASATVEEVARRREGGFGAGDKEDGFSVWGRVAAGVVAARRYLAHLPHRRLLLATHRRRPARLRLSPGRNPRRQPWLPALGR
ncbi:hypothetical protein ACLOJK_030264 [Asimina triloba]